MGDFLGLDDLTPFAEIDGMKAEAMIADAEALALTAAPCLGTLEDLTPGQIAAVKAVLRSAVLRWHESGNGALQSQTTGPFSVTYDDRSPRRSLFWPSEITQLQGICAGDSSGAFSIDTVAGLSPMHAEECSLYFGALYCSCGASLTGSWPLWGSV